VVSHARALGVAGLAPELSCKRMGSILDVGCGDGLLFDRLMEFGEVEV